MQPSISLHKVSVALEGFSALSNINLAFPRGKIIGLLGPSGAGKTTLMRAITGRQHVHRGTVTVLGEPAGSPALRGRIGYMPQAAAVYSDLTVQENTVYFARMLGLGKRDATRALTEVSLNQQIGQLAATLSGGQRSRLSLAIALLGQPELLVLDEPTVGVDPLLRLKLWKIFRMLAAKGTTLCISSHVMDEAERCDDLVLIRRGRVLAHDSPHALRSQTNTATIEETFLKLIR